MKIIAHRGARKYAPENTLPAFRTALEMKSDGFELDTMLSVDGVPVVIHDRSVQRTTNGQGLVDKMNIAELQELDAGNWFSPEFERTKIPLLEEVLDVFGDRCLVNVELKNMHAPFNALPEKVCDLAVRFNCVRNLIFSSFVPFNLVRIKKMIPEARVALLVAPDLLGKVLSSRILHRISPEIIHPHYALCSKRFVIRQHQMGRDVNTWTVNDPNIFSAMRENGVDAVISDDPAIADGNQAEKD